ncbi:MAG TPA: S8 family serine peptidase [Allosphingosinicella sp.]|nr:S8 family serine peptidase [Allosphingosinicella sp.]
MERDQQYILLPSSGLRSATGEAHSLLMGFTNDFFSNQGASSLPDGQDLRVIDVVQENGAKLVETDRATADAINTGPIPLRAVPVIEYPKPRIFPFLNRVLADAAAASAAITITCVDAVTDQPVPNAMVVAFTDFANRIGDQGTSDAQGRVRLSLAGAEIERLYVYGPANYWGAFRRQIPAAATQIGLAPVDLTYVDSVRHYYGASRFDPAGQVRVGVLDSGCGPHPDLNLQPGHATVTGEPDEAADVDIHGTHVAGLIGANGGLRGVAPGVPIYPYRVFPADGGATNYSILKALILAAGDRCDIVNLSLGGGPYDEVVAEAIQDARNQGMLVVVAAGNDDRAAVSYPAAYPGALAVSAMGREGTFPAGSVEEADILRPPHSQLDPAEFIASFSNVGPQICVTAPGVGTLSTLPGGDYGPLSGTSMAAPVVAGAAASLLSQDATVMGMPRNRMRSDAIFNMVVQNGVRRRFGQIFEGFGLPDPDMV